MSDLDFDTLDEYDEGDSLLQILSDITQSIIKKILGEDDE